MSLTYYDILGVTHTAAPAEIETAIETRYNQWRRLVTHHDPNIVMQANQALLSLEQVRKTLLDPAARAAYDAGIGVGEAVVGGLGDPEALLRQAGPPPAPPRPRDAGPAVGTSERLDAWVCPKCQTANAVSTRFCKKCGETIGLDCPNCGLLIESTAEFCPGCGANVAEVAEAKRMQAEEAERERVQREREAAALVPVKKRAKKVGDLGISSIVALGVGFFWGLFSPYFWLIGAVVASILAVICIVQANDFLNTPAIRGDDQLRDMIRGRSRLSVVSLFLSFGVLIWAIVRLIVAGVSMGMG